MSDNFQYKQYSCITAGVAHRCSRRDVFTLRKAPEFTKNSELYKKHIRQIISSSSIEENTIKKPGEKWVNTKI